MGCGGGGGKGKFGEIVCLKLPVSTQPMGGDDTETEDEIFPHTV